MEFKSQLGEDELALVQQWLPRWVRSIDEDGWVTWDVDNDAEAGELWRDVFKVLDIHIMMERSQFRQ